MMQKSQPKSWKAIELLDRGVKSNAPGTQVGAETFGAETFGAETFGVETFGVETCGRYLESLGKTELVRN